jgi:hypothetical protein
MHALSRHWLDYDPIAVLVLFGGLSAVLVLACSI